MEHEERLKEKMKWKNEAQDLIQDRVDQGSYDDDAKISDGKTASDPEALKEELEQNL